jgi:alkyl hydroperoxide reductase subunit AhpF
MVEKMLNNDVIKQIEDIFQQLKEPVQVLFFGRKDDCDYCDDARQLVSEVVAVSDKLSLSIHDLDDDAALAQQYKMDKAPGFVIAGRDGDRVVDYGVRIAGIPAGHEFSSFIHDLILVSSRDSGLNPQTRQYLAQLTEPVHLLVFVTPT